MESGRKDVNRNTHTNGQTAPDTPEYIKGEKWAALLETSLKATYAIKITRYPSHLETLLTLRYYCFLQSEK